VLLGKRNVATLKDYRDHRQLEVSIKEKKNEILLDKEDKDFTYEKMHGEIIEVPWGEPLRILLETEDDGETFGHEICDDNVFDELYGQKHEEKYIRPVEEKIIGNSEYGVGYREEQEENLYGPEKLERQKKNKNGSQIKNMEKGSH